MATLYEATVRTVDISIVLKAPTKEALVALVALYEAWVETPPGEPFSVDNSVIIKPSGERFVGSSIDG